MKKHNFVMITISNVLFCIVLLLLCSLATFKFDLKICSLLSLLCLLLTGIYSGSCTAKTVSHKKLLFAILNSTIFAVLYLALCFLYPGENSPFSAYMVAISNIYLGTFIGCILALDTKKKRRFKK